MKKKKRKKKRGVGANDQIFKIKANLIDLGQITKSFDIKFSEMGIAQTCWVFKAFQSVLNAVARRLENLLLPPNPC